MPTDITLALAARQLVDENFEVTVTACLEPGGAGRAVRVFVVQSLTQYPGARSYDRNTVMQGLDGVDVTLAAGACGDVVGTIKFDPESWALRDRIQLTAWAQAPLELGPAEVYQAKQILWPFVELPLFADGFEKGDTRAWATTAP